MVYMKNSILKLCALSFLLVPVLSNAQSTPNILSSYTEGAGVVDSDIVSPGILTTVQDSATTSTTSSLIGFDIISSDLTSNGATIAWKTNNPSTSQVEYGLTNSYGNSTYTDLILGTIHKLQIAMLSPGTVYNYRVISKDSFGNVYTSPNQVLITLKQVSYTNPNNINQTSSSNVAGISAQFSKDLKLGMRDPQVKLLQQYLNRKGFVITKTGVGSPGFESDYFGSATKAALIRFQVSNKISPPSGNFGPLTRGVANAN